MNVPNTTTTVIGKWDDVVDGGGTREFIESGVSRSGENVGVINALSETVDPNWNNDQIWDNVTKPWIDSNSIKITPADRSTVSAIRNGQDTGGTLSEQLADQALGQNGYVPVPQATRAAPGSQGFDNVLIRRDATGNIEDIVINESKQLSSSSAGFQMSRISGQSNSLCANGCTQMSNQWIDDVLVRMSGNSNNPAGQQLAQEIRNFNRANPNGITRTISGVDRSTGELLIIKI